MSEDEIDPWGGSGGFRHISYSSTSILRRLLDSDVREIELEGGWKAVQHVSDLTVMSLHGPSGTKMTALINPRAGMTFSSFEFYAPVTLSGARRAELEAAHRFFWKQWDGEGDPLEAYRRAKQSEAE